MEFSALFAKLKKELSPYAITSVVDVGDCYVVSVCDEDGYPLLQPPYAVSRDGGIGSYNIYDDEMAQKLEDGRVLYTDYSPLKVKPPERHP